MDAFTRYERAREIGAGASGTVYEAVDRSDGARVALKVLRHPTPEGLYRFKKEFRAMRGIEHPNLVHLRELGVENGQWFFTMDLVPGADFNAYVCCHGETGGEDDTVEIEVGAPRFDEQRLRASFHQLAQALTALHARGKVHRDLKPTNVRVQPDGRLYVLDFGLVLDEQELMRSSIEVILGTPAYMAPEQATCSDVGPAADWYSAGVMLYEALTGMLPFGGTLYEMLDVTRRAHPPSAAANAPGVPADLDRLCADLLRADPIARPNGHEVLARLARVPWLAARQRPRSLPGREGELEVMARTVERARAGELAAAVVLGPTRSGKSAILSVAAASASLIPGTAVLTTRCHPGEHVPFLPLDGIVDSLTRVLADIPPREQKKLVPPDAAALVAVFPVIRRIAAFKEVRAHVPDDLERALVDGLLHVLRGVSERRLLVLCIDDLQHSDPAGMRALNAILKHPAAPAMAVLLAAREMPKPALPYRVLRMPVAPPVWADEHDDDTIDSGLRAAV